MRWKSSRVLEERIGSIKSKERRKIETRKENNLHKKKGWLFDGTLVCDRARVVMHPSSLLISSTPLLLSLRRFLFLSFFNSSVTSSLFQSAPLGTLFCRVTRSALSDFYCRPAHRRRPPSLCNDRVQVKRLSISALFFDIFISASSRFYG